MSGSRGDILLVEDDEDLRELLAELLRSHGHEVRVAEHGAQALAVLRNGEPLPALILLDMMMPIMDGPGFRAEQRKDPALAQIPVFVLTARGDSKTSMADMGCARLFGKPVPLASLLGAIDEQLCGRPSADGGALRFVPRAEGEPDVPT